VTAGGLGAAQQLAQDQLAGADGAAVAPVMLPRQRLVGRDGSLKVSARDAALR
jgi:hypothetical protein